MHITRAPGMTPSSNRRAATASPPDVPFGAFERYTPAGTPADIAQFLAPYRDAGAAMFNLTPIARSTEEGVEAIGEVKRLLAQG